MDGNIYAEFANHLLDAGLLHEKFFELDDNFNPTKNNLSYHLRLESYINDDEMDLDSASSSKSKSNSIQDEIEKMEKEARRVYNDNLAQIQNISPNINGEALNQIRKKLNPEITSWIESNIKNMSDEDYGKFMVYVAYNRNR
tara:strand:- start:2535 stop:2960 length:426 start_codon:yes stop_codon:yes gene_type:complete